MILTCTAANKGDTGKVPEPEIGLILFQNVEPRNLWSPAVRPYSLQNTPKTDHADIDEGHRHIVATCRLFDSRGVPVQRSAVTNGSTV